ncbi:DUF1501 domain-containing protein [Botrimarina mediterranea]|uniref:DUF1501 domain-containing protein n=1 Tax=Botrimarina mediterranea TaxID=2528022 RepID=A0A518K943_9BACT|nr:DUF1501 domain-containing protein [Botrimarina mediterranea]QDV74311.1 hypothetical protein Spa11_25130 [Botrimarina mediterranea]
MFTRRDFLRTTSLVTAAPFVPTFLAKTSRAATPVADDRVLVVIQLDGGNDGLNTVVPYGDDGYGRARKALRLKESDLLRIDDHVGLHPRMKGAKQLFDDGRLAIVQGVGYPNPDRSHFSSMRIWQSGRRHDADLEAYGWLGRTLDLTRGNGSASVDAEAFFVGNQATPFALWGRRCGATALTELSDLTLDGSFPPLRDSDRTDLGSFVTRQMRSAYTAAEAFAHAEQAAVASRTSYPSTEIASHLSVVAKLLRIGSSARVFYASQTGYDTHASQLYTHGNLLREFSDALKAFLDDLRANGLDERVVVLAFSEFGRRVAENDSKGTDHGAAGPVFVAGAPINGGLYGKTPDLSALIDGDLPLGVDFRSVYATLLDQWVGVSSEEVLGERYDPLPLI